MKIMAYVSIGVIAIFLVVVGYYQLQILTISNLCTADLNGKEIQLLLGTLNEEKIDFRIDERYGVLHFYSGIEASCFVRFNEGGTIISAEFIGE